MLFSTSIPDKLQEYPNVSAFMGILDELQNLKTEIIASSLRVDNAAVLMDKKWLLKKLEEFGVNDIPLDYPIQIMQQYLLNVDTICSTRGSKKGVELYCSLLSLGKVTIDDSKFYTDTSLLLLDSVLQGYITEDNSSKNFYLCADTSEVEPLSELKIKINSKYFNGEYTKEEGVIKKYIEGTISKYLGFSPNKKITFIYGSASDFYFHNLLNSYFV